LAFGEPGFSQRGTAMKSLMRLAVFGTALAMTLSAVAAVPPVYVVTDLGTLQTLPTCGPTEDPAVDPCVAWSSASFGHGVNDHGDVVGNSETGDIDGITLFPISHAFVNDGTSMQDLGVLSTSDIFSDATGINNNGRVVGFSESDTGTRSAYYYDAGDGAMTDIPVGNPSTAQGLNNNGVIIGTANNQEYDCHLDVLGQGPNGPTDRAFVYNPSDSTISYVPLLPDGTNNYAYGINDSGQVAGYSFVPGIDPYTNQPVNDVDGCPTYSNHAYLYDPLLSPPLTDLGTLPGGTDSEAYALSSSGQVVGYSMVGDVALPDYDTGYHAFSYTLGGGMVDLGMLLGGTYSEAHGVNDAGMVVGWANDSTDTRHAFVYDPSTSTMYDLNDLLPVSSGWELWTAAAINNKGQITGDGTYTYNDPDTGMPVSVDRAYLLTPDTDGDGVADVAVGGAPADNCTLLPNPGAAQLDTDGDGIGNRCDCDFNQDNACGAPDFGLFIGCFGAPTGENAVCKAADMNGDGVVGAPDFGLFIGGFGGPPGPPSM